MSKLYYNLGQYLCYDIQTWHNGRLMHGIRYIYMLMLVSMTLTLTQGHSGSAMAAKQISVELSRQLSKQQALSLVQRYAGFVLVFIYICDIDFENDYMA